MLWTILPHPRETNAGLVPNVAGGFVIDFEIDVEGNAQTAVLYCCCAVWAEPSADFEPQVATGKRHLDSSHEKRLGEKSSRVGPDSPASGLNPSCLVFGAESSIFGGVTGGGTVNRIRWFKRRAQSRISNTQTATLDAYVRTMYDIYDVPLLFVVVHTWCT